MSAKLNKIEAIYSAALEKRSDAERSAFLDTACGNDSTTRTRVEALLRANSEARDFLKIPPSFRTYPHICR